MVAARRQHIELLRQRAVAAKTAGPRDANLAAAWTAVGPAQVVNPVYGAVTGRVTAVAIDPADASGNTVYIGTTGGGVWKSTNAAGAAGSVKFSALTDTLPVFNLSAGSGVTPSLSVGALAVANGVLLAGTGDPNDATDSYYGGGILRSTDGGLTWALAVGSHDGANGNHSFVGLGVAEIAFSTLNPGVVVAAMTQSVEGDVVNAENSSSVMGLYVSNDAGQTWQMATIMDGSQVVQAPEPSSTVGVGNAATAVVWNAARQRFYAAVRFHGYYESADGLTWTRLAQQPGAGLTRAACPTNPGLSGNPSCPMLRGALAVQAATGDTFALTVDASDNDEGLYQDVCAMSASGGCGNATVAFANKLNSTPLEVGSGSAEVPQADYDLELTAVASGNDTLLYAGAVDLYRCSLAGGCVLRDTTNALNGCPTPANVAPAQHAIAAVGPLVFLGNDGGLWRSMDGVAETGGACSAGDASHFDNLNYSLGSLAEVVSLAQDPTEPGPMLAGVGALGSAGTGTARAAGAWAQMSTGEGGTVAIDQASPQNWYVATGAGVNIGRCVKGSQCGLSDFAVTAIGAAQVDGDDSEVNAPWMLDPAASNQMLIGTCRAWRGPAAGGAAWMGGDLLSSPFAAPKASGCGDTFPVVRSLGAGGADTSAGTAPNLGSAVLYAGIAGAVGGPVGISGHVFTTVAGASASAATEWTDAGLSPVTNAAADAGVFNPGGFDVSSVTADPHDVSGATVYATVMGFAGNGLDSPHVYRSTDGGAHWTNVSANLPNAPANALAVDPNDANTVYVALDTGVYATTMVTSCASSNCWTPYGTSLPNAPVTSLAVSAGMDTGDGRRGELRAGTYGRGVWEVPLVTAVSPAAPAITLNPTALIFANQQVATQSATQTITVTNSGNAALTVTSVVTSGDFVESNTCTAIAVGPMASCSVTVKFAPVATGSRSGLLTVYGNVAGGQATATLSGVGTAPAAIVLTPTSLDFGSTMVGTTSTAQNVTVSNTGGTSAAIQSVGAAGSFAISANSCGSSLAPGTGCTVVVEFVPKQSGQQSGTLTVVDDAGTQVAELSGTGTNPATDTLSPASLTFGGQALNTASAAQQVTLTNAGDMALTLVTASVTGDFTVVNGCGASLAALSSCGLSVTYVPKNLGSETGVLTVSDALRVQMVSLSGTGLAPAGVSISPVGALTFAATPVGQVTAAQAVTLTNNGGQPLTISGLTLLGDFVTGTNTCGGTIAGGASCTFQISFAPTVGGTRTGTLTFVDNASSSPQVVTLSGIGIDFGLEIDGTNAATVTSGQTASYLVLLSSAANVPGNVALTCTGVPLSTTCSVSPANPALGVAGGTILTVSVATGQTIAAMVQPEIGVGGRLAWLALTLPAGWLMRRRRGHRLLALLVCVALLGAAGCGSVSRTIPDAGGTSSGGGGGSGTIPTPAGTYPLVLTGTSAGLTRSVDLTLVVQ